MADEILGVHDRVLQAVGLLESHYREFKSGWHGPSGRKRPRNVSQVRREIGDTLVGFANGDGGELLVGVEDDGEITGLGHTEADIQTMLDSPMTQVHADTPIPPPLKLRVMIDSKLVLYFAVDKGTELVHLTSDGRCLQRKDRETVPVATEQIRFERQEKLSREYDRNFINGANVTDLDPELLGRVAGGVLRGVSAEKCLQYWGLADFSMGVLHLRRAALLLFAKEINRWHPRCGVRIMRVRGTQLQTAPSYNVEVDRLITDNI